MNMTQLYAVDKNDRGSRRRIDIDDYLGRDRVLQQAVRWDEQRDTRWPRWRVALIRCAILAACVAWIVWLVRVIV